MDMTPIRLDHVLTPHRRAEVSIVLAERHENMRQLLVSALIAQRLSLVTSVGELEGAETLIANGEHDILILDGGLPGREGNAFDLVRKIRRGAIGTNPFIAIFLTLWQPSREAVRLAGECGADAILVKPLSPAALVERVAALAATRKRYVAVGDYVGPDRRRPNPRPFATEPVEVPNTLAMKAKGTFDPVTLAEALGAAEDAMRDLWLQRQSLRLAALARVMEEDPTDGAARLMESVADDLSQGLLGIAGSDFGPEAQLADTVGQVTRAIAKRQGNGRARAMVLLPPMIEALLALTLPQRSRCSLEAEIRHLAQGEAERLNSSSIKREARRRARMAIDQAMSAVFAGPSLSGASL